MIYTAGRNSKTRKKMMKLKNAPHTMIEPPPLWKVSGGISSS